MRRNIPTPPEDVPLSVGTRVILQEDLSGRDGRLQRTGSILRVEEAHHPRYVLRSPSGRILDAQRRQLVPQHPKQLETTARQRADWSRLAHTVVLEAVVGSSAYNLSDADSDVDTRGAFVLPWAERAGLFETPTELLSPYNDSTFYEVERLIRLGLRGDANIVETLWSPTILRASEMGELLLRHREIFLSQRIYGTFGRYAIGQLERMERKLTLRETERALVSHMASRPHASVEELTEGLVGEGHGHRDHVAKRMREVAHSYFDRGLTDNRSIAALRDCLTTNPHEPEPYRPKNAYNLLRLLHSGIQMLKTGVPLVRIETDREDGLHGQLTAIKRGEVPLRDILREARELSGELEDAVATSVLPRDPDREAANVMLQTCRTWSARRHFQLPSQPRIIPAVDAQPDAGAALPAEVCTCLKQLTQDLDTVHSVLSGSRLYGFNTPHSDLDIRGVHIDEAASVLGLEERPRVMKQTLQVGKLTVDWLSYEAKAAIQMLIRGHGGMLEDLLAPAWETVPASDRRRELQALVAQAAHKGFANHYLGYLRQRIKRTHQSHHLKDYLHAFRIGLTGAHLMRTGQVVVDLDELTHGSMWAHATQELLARRQASVTQPARCDEAYADKQLAHLMVALEQNLSEAIEASALPNTCPNQAALGQWLAFWRTSPPH